MKLNKDMVEKAYNEEKSLYEKYGKDYEEALADGENEKALEIKSAVEFYYKRMMQAEDLLIKLA